MGLQKAYFPGEGFRAWGLAIESRGMGNESSRAAILRSLEDQAELLVADQLDLLAQLEAQLRAVHQSMRRIGTLRAARHRAGAEPTNGERRATLVDLSEEIAAIEGQILTQQTTCHDMQETIRRMQDAAARLRQVASEIRDTPDRSEEA